MTARDGVRLATDVWRPARDGEPLPGPFPAILLRTPYNRARPTHQEMCEFLAGHGYLAAIQDCRGRYASEGEFVLLANEGPDGYDAIEWLASLPYCDGNVGTYGTSYLAWVQNAAAIERPPHLKAMWVNQGGANGNTATLRHNGALELRWLTWAVTFGTVSREALRDPELQASLTRAGERMYEWLRRLPWSGDESPLAGLPSYERCGPRPVRARRRGRVLAAARPQLRRPLRPHRRRADHVRRAPGTTPTRAPRSRTTRR